MNIKWDVALPVWWSIVWRGTLYGFGLGLLFGAIGGFYAGFTGIPEQSQFYGSIGGYIAGIPASMLAVKQGVQKHLAKLAVSPATALPI